MASETQAGTRHDAGASSEPGGTLAFFCGADMNPLSIGNGNGRVGFARARFVAIASSMEESTAGRAGLPAALGTGEIWGIVLAIAPPHAPPPNPAPSSMVTVVLRNGATTEAALMTDPTTVGTIAGVLAEARYWELPIAYRDRLEALLSQ